MGENQRGRGSVDEATLATAWPCVPTRSTAARPSHFSPSPLPSSPPAPLRQLTYRSRQTHSVPPLARHAQAGRLGVGEAQVVTLTYKHTLTGAHDLQVVLQVVNGRLEWNGPRTLDSGGEGGGGGVEEVGVEEGKERRGTIGDGRMPGGKTYAMLPSSAPHISQPGTSEL